MNKQFQSWFSQGKVAEALCGLGDYFVPDVTYRDDHDFGLAVDQLVTWAKEGHLQDAATGFEQAVTRLVQTGALNAALLLMRSYAILMRETSASLPLDMERIANILAGSVQKNSSEIARDEGIRNLLLMVSQDFPLLQSRIGVKQAKSV